ncbi:proton-conducting transporter membrane subunit, partial [uncultured Hyphomonas sp.]
MSFRRLRYGLQRRLIGAFASGFLLYGMAYLYGATGSTNIERIQSFLSS